MLRNTDTSYGSIAKWNHWLVALCFLVAYVAVYISIWFLTEDDWLHPILRQLHVTFGLSVLAIAIFRVYWRWTNTVPDPVAAPRWQHTVANAAHVLLYFFVFAMPISGYLSYGGSVDFVIFEIPPFRKTDVGLWVFDVLGVTWEEFEAPVDYFHKKIAGAWIVWILVVIHAGAALHHHFVRRDEVLIRMLPGRSK